MTKAKADPQAKASIAELLILDDVFPLSQSAFAWLNIEHTSSISAVQ